jgi:Uma2 family endonuclease
MTAMAMTPGAPYGRPFTADDLDQMPDDGHRYELLDGTLLVSPAPTRPHQTVVGALFALLWVACPEGMEALPAPFAVRLGEDTEFQPDILIARSDDLTMANLPAPPLLAVEVRSPSTALIDLNLKRAAYERHAVPSYWIVDPNLGKPSITAYELSADGCYTEVAHVTGDATFRSTKPFPFEVTPATLLARLPRP